MIKGNKKKTWIIAIATVAIFACSSLFFIKANIFDIPEVDMREGGYNIINVEDLHNFKSGNIEKVKVIVSEWSTTNQDVSDYIYKLTRKDSKIYVEKYNATEELIEEATCEKLEYWYEPESWASDRVQLQGCSPGQEIYDFGYIAL